MMRISAPPPVVLRLSFLLMALAVATQPGQLGLPGSRASAADKPKPPAAPPGFVFGQTFVTDTGQIGAGTGFFARLPDYPRPILLTALHVLGPAGGLPKDVLPTEVPKVVKRLQLQDCFDATRTLSFTSEPLVIPEAAPLGKEGKAGDILAFWAPAKAKVHVLSLAAEAPKKGDPLWLVALVAEGPREQRLHPATMEGLTDQGGYTYWFDDPKLTKRSMRGTSGAPVINAQGRLVAIHSGSGEQDGKLFGGGNPVERFKPYLEAAAKKSSKRR